MPTVFAPTATLLRLQFLKLFLKIYSRNLHDFPRAQASPLVVVIWAFVLLLFSFWLHRLLLFCWMQHTLWILTDSLNAHRSLFDRSVFVFAIVFNRHRPLLRPLSTLVSSWTLCLFGFFIFTGLCNRPCLLRTFVLMKAACFFVLHSYRARLRVPCFYFDLLRAFLSFAGH